MCRGGGDVDFVLSRRRRTRRMVLCVFGQFDETVFDELMRHVFVVVMWCVCGGGEGEMGGIMGGGGGVCCCC